jgi:hypothetical protein
MEPIQPNRTLHIILIATGASLAKLHTIRGGDIVITINKASGYYPHDAAMANDPEMVKHLQNSTGSPIITRWRKNLPEGTIGLPMCDIDQSINSQELYSLRLTGLSALDLVCQYLTTTHQAGNIYLVGYDHGGARKFSGPPPCSLYDKPAETYYARFKAYGHKIFAINSDKLGKVFISAKMEELILPQRSDNVAAEDFVRYAHMRMVDYEVGCNYVRPA